MCRTLLCGKVFKKSITVCIKLYKWWNAIGNIKSMQILFNLCIRSYSIQLQNLQSHNINAPDLYQA